MQLNSVSANRPNYVLIDGDLRIGPKVVPLDSGTECVVIYGFSDNGAYVKFCANSELGLRPYPLVKGYLQNQIDASSNRLKLVVTDAAGPNAPSLQATTMQSVLAAQTTDASHVMETYRLTFDNEANAYRVEKLSEVEN